MTRKIINKFCLRCDHAKRFHKKGYLTLNLICFSCPPLKMYHEFQFDKLKFLEDKYDQNLAKTPRT